MATKPKSGLGKGLGALLGGETQIPEQNENSIKEVNINDVEPGPHQPRKFFDEEKLQELTDSIKQYGIIDPLIVKKSGNKYFIIAGERRWRAARRAGLKKVPIIEKDVSDSESMEIALIDNLQRSDLNPIEEAEAYQRLISEFKLTQEKLSEKVGKNRTTITNSLRLLNFDEEIRKMIADGRLSAGNARPLLSIENKETRLSLANRIVDGGLSARQVESLAKKASEKPSDKNDAKESKEDNKSDIITKTQINHIQNELKNALGTKVKLSDENGKGKIIIEYYSADERERLIDLLMERK